MGNKRSAGNGAPRGAAESGARTKRRPSARNATKVPRTRRFTVIYQAVPPEDGSGFYAHIPALDITTEGETLKEAKEMARDAIECFLETAQAIGQMIPEEAASETVEIAV